MLHFAPQSETRMRYCNWDTKLTLFKESKKGGLVYREKKQIKHPKSQNVINY